MKRYAAAIALCLLAGAIITLLIAWTLAVTVDVYAKTSPYHAMSQYEDWHWQASRYDGFGSVRLSSGWFLHEYPGTTAASPDEFIPRWSGLQERPTDELIAENRLIDARGWPWIGFSCDVYRARVRAPRDVDAQQVVFGFKTPLPEWNQTRAYAGTLALPSPRVLPYRPVWGGFLANTLLYALLLWIAFVARPQFIAWRRNRRGQCVKCAYPRGTSPVCTECGHPV